MIDKRVYFLSGLPRTGSTLLGSILAQNPDIYVTPTSPLYPLLVNTNEQFNLLDTQYTFDCKGTSKRVYEALIKAFYAGIKQPIIFDKHRGWPKHVPAISEYLNPDARIICTVRPLAEIITSYLVLADKDENNFIDVHLKKDGRLITNENRADLLWSTYLKTSYESMREGLKTHPENILLIEYRDIVFKTEKVLREIYAFCGLERFNHYLSGIENRCAEAKDEAWGLKNLHTIRPELEIKSSDPLAYLPKEAVEYFSKFDNMKNL
jgi:sulfotransferase